jgi:hypothetical protein
MSASIPEKFENVSVPPKANVYFGGRVVSHTLLFKDGTKKTLGLIFEGSFNFETNASETMANPSKRPATPPLTLWWRTASASTSAATNEPAPRPSRSRKGAAFFCARSGLAAGPSLDPRAMMIGW